MILQDSPWPNIPDRGISCKDLVPSGRLWDRAARKGFGGADLLTNIKPWCLARGIRKAAKRKKGGAGAGSALGAEEASRGKGWKNSLHERAVFCPGRNTKRGRRGIPDGRCLLHGV